MFIKDRNLLPMSDKANRERVASSCDAVRVCVRINATCLNGTIRCTCLAIRA